MNDFYSTDSQKSARVNGEYDRIMASLTKCPFCDLKEKYFIENGKFSVLTCNLFPYTDGHLLVITKRHIEKFEDINLDEWAEIKKLIDLGVKKLRANLEIENFNILANAGPKSGASLGHFHIQLIPAEKQILSKQYQTITISPQELAERLRND